MATKTKKRYSLAAMLVILGLSLAVGLLILISQPDRVPASSVGVLPADLHIIYRTWESVPSGPEVENLYLVIDGSDSSEETAAQLKRHFESLGYEMQAGGPASLEAVRGGPYGIHIEPLRNFVTSSDVAEAPLVRRLKETVKDDNGDLVLVAVFLV
jgi:hypothetical protein